MNLLGRRSRTKIISRGRELQRVHLLVGGRLISPGWSAQEAVSALGSCCIAADSMSLWLDEFCLYYNSWTEWQMLMQSKMVCVLNRSHSKRIN